MLPEDERIFNADDLLSWFPYSRQLPRPPRAWSHWLRDPGSLTRRLLQLSDGDFSVRVLEQGWRSCQSRALVSCFPSSVLRQRMWSRKVVLLGRGEPWVTAHTLLPARSLRGSLRRMRFLQERPLGEFLFRHPGLRRLPPEVAPAGDHWGRRSIFSLQGKPLLVAEFFLPALVFGAHDR